MAPRPFRDLRPVGMAVCVGVAMLASSFLWSSAGASVLGHLKAVAIATSLAVLAGLIQRWRLQRERGEPGAPAGSLREVGGSCPPP